MHYWRALIGTLGFDWKKIGLAWILAVLYAATDEIHQILTPGRHPSPLDVLLFDGGGAAIALNVVYWFRKRKAIMSGN
jgi:VanZ family protein